MIGAKKMLVGAVSTKRYSDRLIELDVTHLWPLQSNLNSIVYDPIAGHAGWHHLTVRSNGTAVSYVTGPGCDGGDFGATASKINLGVDTIYASDNTLGYSMSIWVKHPNPSSESWIPMGNSAPQWEGGPTGGYYWQFASNGELRFYGGSFSQPVNRFSNQALHLLEPNIWTHVCITVNHIDNLTRYYKNGTLLATSTTTSVNECPPLNSTKFTIGGWGILNNSIPTNATVAWAAHWRNKTLTSGEVALIATR